MPHPTERQPQCRSGCGACCIAPSISSPIPLGSSTSAQGKPAGARCPQLDAACRCRLFGRPERPSVCVSLQPSVEMCRGSALHAMRWISRLERRTAPG